MSSLYTNSPVTPLQDEFSAVQQAISSGTFDPQGSAYTTFAGTTIQPPQPIAGSNLLSGGSGNPTQPVLGSQGNPLQPLQGSTLSYGATPAQSGTTSAAPSSGPVAGSIADYFARTIIVILGFIFVAVGLHMLMPNTVPNVARVVKP